MENMNAVADDKIPAAAANAVANTIAKQMGGFGRLKSMTGARDFAFDRVECGALTFRLPQSGNVHRIGRVKVTLEASDTYRMDFLRIRTGRTTAPVVEIISSKSGVYADQLVAIFEAVTGLYLTF